MINECSRTFPPQQHGVLSNRLELRPRRDLLSEQRRNPAESSTKPATEIKFNRLVWDQNFSSFATKAFERSQRSSYQRSVFYWQPLESSFFSDTLFKFYHCVVILITSLGETFFYDSSSWTWAWPRFSGKLVPRWLSNLKLHGQDRSFKHNVKNCFSSSRIAGFTRWKEPPLDSRVKSCTFPFMTNMKIICMQRH